MLSQRDNDTRLAFLDHMRACDFGDMCESAPKQVRLLQRGHEWQADAVSLDTTQDMGTSSTVLSRQANLQIKVSYSI